MYLSCLEVDTSAPRGRRWLADPYCIHQRLRLGFGDDLDGRLLFRVEEAAVDGGRPARVLVQAPFRADWVRAFAGHQVLREAQQKEVRYALSPGQRLRFALRANPTVRRLGGRNDNGERVSGPREGVLGEANQLAWLWRKGETGGFGVRETTVRDLGFVKVHRPDGQTQTHLTVEYTGVLEVIDPAALVTMAEAGIGTGKGFGFGLLLLARAD